MSVFPQRQFATVSQINADAGVEAQPINFATIQSGINEILGRYIDPAIGGLTPQNTQDTTYLAGPTADITKQFSTPNGESGYGPYRDHPALVDIVSYVEDAGDVIITQNGRSAIDTVMTLLPAGSHVIVAPDNVYPGTRIMLDRKAARGLIGVTYTNSTPEALERAYIPGRTKMVIFEPVSNPMMKTADIAATSAFAHSHGIWSVADNTSTMMLVQPLKNDPASETNGAYDCDFSCGSLTKGLGANKVMAGYIAFNKAADEGLVNEVNTGRKYETGAHLAEDLSNKMVLIATDYALRMQAHSRNAKVVAEHLAQHPLVERVRSPWLPGDPGYNLARRQFGGAAAFFTVELKADKQDIQHLAEYFHEQAMKNIARRQQRPARPDADQCGILIADSFGGEKTTLVFSDRQTNPNGLPEGIKPGTVRVAVGRGDPELDIRDLDGSLDHMAAQRRPAFFVVPGPRG